MKTVLIPEQEYLQMQEMIAALQQKLKQYSSSSVEPSSPVLSIERGSGKSVITFIADDFTAPLDDFKDYM
jgi:hypothetical protein